jgi:hypothetical protein
VASINNVPGGSGALLRSVNRGVNFDSVASTFPGLPTALSLQRGAGGTGFVALLGGQSNAPFVFRYESATGTLQAATGIQSSGGFTNVVLAPDRTHALVTLRAGTNLTSGALYASTDGGLTFAPVSLPSSAFALFGAGFLTNTQALVVGDSSFIGRYDFGTNTVTPLGPANGIPQTVVDPATGALTVYRFTRAGFATPQIGWVTGQIIKHVPGIPDVVTGIILQTVDGGQTFTRQGIQGAANSGQDFPGIIDLSVLSSEFAAVSGVNGMIASRSGATGTPVSACAFNGPQAGH